MMGDSEENRGRKGKKKRSKKRKESSKESILKQLANAGKVRDK